MQLDPISTAHSRAFLLNGPPPGVLVPSNVQADRGRRSVAGLAPWQARRAQDFLIANLEGGPTIASAAAECRLSISHFARAFKQTTGLPPHQWLTRQRLRRAKDLMQAGRLALAEVAAACGFSDQSHFTRVFVAGEGRSPAKWQRARRGLGTPASLAR